MTGNFKKKAILKLESADSTFLQIWCFRRYSTEQTRLPMAFQNANSNNGNSFTRENTLVIGDTHRDIQSAEHKK